MFVGDGTSLSRDEWGHARADRLTAATVPFRSGPTRWQDLRRDLGRLLRQWGIRPQLDLEEGQSPVSDVAWRTGMLNGTLVANLCNFGHTARKVTLIRNGKPVRGTDLDGKPIGPTLTLRPLRPVLVKIGP